MNYSIICPRCAQSILEKPRIVSCPQCGGALELTFPPPSEWDSSDTSMWRYRAVLPVSAGTNVITLNEGGTPLIPSRSFEGAQVYIKNETLNPTGSHKDRALSIGVSKAIEFGCNAVMLYSDGSTALSSAAYAARAGLISITAVGRGVPDFRLLPLMVYGSNLLEYQGTAAEALDWVHEACQRLDIYETSTYRLANPFEAEGPKTVGYEIYDQLGHVPDWIVVPVGGGGTFAGIYQAFADLVSWERADRLPRMVGVLPEGYGMLSIALERGITTDEELRQLAPDDAPPTIQAKIAMTFPPDGIAAINAVRESSGSFLYASDEDALAGQKRLGSQDGIYAEPSASVAIAGVEKLLSDKRYNVSESVVAVITGSGFRETGAIADRIPVTRIPVDAQSGLEELKVILEKGTKKHG